MDVLPSSWWPTTLAVAYWLGLALFIASAVSGLALGLMWWSEGRRVR